MSKQIDPVKLSHTRKRNSINTANFRARQAANTSFMKKRINEILIKLNRPPVDFSKSKTANVLKGKPRPNHVPPRELRVTMSKEEMSKWKSDQRRQRKAQQAKARRVREDEMHKKLKAMWASLEQEIAQVDSREAAQLSDASSIAAVSVESDDGGSTFDIDGDGWKVSASQKIIERSRSKEQARDTPASSAVSMTTERSPAEAPLLFLANIASTHIAKQGIGLKPANVSALRPYSLDMMF